jgi:hypothetical protein
MLESNCETNEVTRLFADLDKPSLHTLSYALRHPDTWPNGFVWNFQDCKSCAMGLAHELWFASENRPTGKTPDSYHRAAVSAVARRFALPYAEAQRIFLRSDWAVKSRMFGLVKEKIPMSAITPEMVADEIDRYLARAE